VFKLDEVWHNFNKINFNDWNFIIFDLTASQFLIEGIKLSEFNVWINTYPEYIVLK